MNGSHTCPARGCVKAVGNDRLFCIGHWRKVPRHLQRAIYQHYRPGQTIATATEEYKVAMREAIRYVDSLGR